MCDAKNVYLLVFTALPQVKRNGTRQAKSSGFACRKREKGKSVDYQEGSKSTPSINLGYLDPRYRASLDQEEKKRSVGIRRFTSRTLCSILVMRFDWSLFQGTCGASAFK
eukprot:scaffold93211_cov12-Tisochrysis_lutea.AAC.1